MQTQSASMGYDPTFLGIKLSLPKFSLTVCATLLNSSRYEIKYIHYSSFLHKNRMIPFMTACNIRGELYNAPSRNKEDEPWDYSDQVDKTIQLGEAFYSNDGNTFDRGHLVRRVDPCWGDASIMEDAELGTFRWTNCTPQHKLLNRQGGVWYQLEQHVIEHGVKGKAADVTVLAGPVLAENDHAMLMKAGKYKGMRIQIPTEFWKMIVWKKMDGKLYAVGFLMSQWEFIKDVVVPMPLFEQFKMKVPKPPLADDYFEQLKFKDHKTYQVPITAIEKKTGIRFDWANVTFPYTKSKETTIEGVTSRGTLLEDEQKRLKALTLEGLESFVAGNKLELRNVTL